MRRSAGAGGWADDCCRQNQIRSALEGFRACYGMLRSVVLGKIRSTRRGWYGSGAAYGQTEARYGRT